MKMDLENKERGFVYLHRQLIDGPLIADSQLFHLWVYLILRVNHKPNYHQGVLINRGQTKTGRKQLSEKLNINESKIERLLTILESEQQIEQQKTTKYRIITIKNYDQYQNKDNKANNSQQQRNNKRTTKNTNNNDKNVNNDKKEYIGVKAFLTFFGEQWKQAVGNGKTYNCQFGKEGKLVKGLLGIYSYDDLCSLATKFFQSDDDFIRNTGYTISVFYSQIAKLIAGNKKLTKTERTMQKAQELIGRLDTKEVAHD